MRFYAGKDSCGRCWALGLILFRLLYPVWLLMKKGRAEFASAMPLFSYYYMEINELEIESFQKSWKSLSSSVFVLKYLYAVHMRSRFEVSSKDLCKTNLFRSDGYRKATA